MNNSTSISLTRSSIRLLFPVMAVAMTILFCDSCQPEKECTVKNGVCQGACVITLYLEDGTRVLDATCQSLPINGKDSCGCFLRFTGGESCVRDPTTKGCVEKKPCPVYYKDSDKNKAPKDRGPVKGECMETPGECNCLYVVKD